MFWMDKNVFQKADCVRQLVSNSLGKECTDNEILSILGRAYSFDEGTTQTAPDEVRIVLNRLKSKGINPNTAFKYMKMSMLPAHVKEKVYGRKMSSRKALLVATDEHMRNIVDLENIVFEQGMKAIKGLRKCQ